MSLCRRTAATISLAFAIVFVTFVRSLHAQSTASEMHDEVSFTSDIGRIAHDFCATCHAGDDPEGELVLTSYEDIVRHTREGNLLERINDSDDPMPPAGLMPMYMRRLFQAWADQGFVNQGGIERDETAVSVQEFSPPNIVPIDIDERGFEMLGYLQGHWVGSMNLMGQDLDWMAFDYRPIAPSHIHAIFEGGTIGNLFTSFFVAQFKGKRTIMARNGGLLNGIYRTSYFVLDRVEYGKDWAYYRLVDAHGGKDIMFMELTFRGNTLEFNASTSRFGLTALKPHMAFRGTRMHRELAAKAAAEVGFPKKVVDFDFSDGLPQPTWAEDYPLTSASYLCEKSNPSLIGLGKQAKDPRRIDQMPYLSQLEINVTRNPMIEGKKLLVYLSRDSLVDPQGKFILEYGYIREDLLNTLLSFPELGTEVTKLTFTYLHPGDYFLTVIADMDDDGLPTPGDITHAPQRVTVLPNSHSKVVVGDLDARN